MRIECNDPRVLDGLRRVGVTENSLEGGKIIGLHRLMVAGNIRIGNVGAGKFLVKYLLGEFHVALFALVSEIADDEDLIRALCDHIAQHAAGSLHKR